MYLSIGLILILSSTLVMHMVLYAEEYIAVNKHTKDTLFTSAVLLFSQNMFIFALKPRDQHFILVLLDSAKIFIFLNLFLVNTFEILDLVGSLFTEFLSDSYYAHQRFGLVERLKLKNPLLRFLSSFGSFEYTYILDEK